MSREEQFGNITGEMLDIYIKKNRDYGNSFEKSLEEFGDIAFVVRASDKMERIKSLANIENEVKDESVDDTVMDLANYCIMFLMWKAMQDYKEKRVKYDANTGSTDIWTVGNCERCGRLIHSDQKYTTLNGLGLKTVSDYKSGQELPYMLCEKCVRDVGVPTVLP